MKLKLTPTNVSLLALSAVGALVAQELTRTEAQTPTPTGDKFKRKQSNLAARTAANPTALAQPELGGQESGALTAKSKPQPASVSVPKTTELAISELPPPPSTALKVKLPPPPQMESASSGLKSVSVDQLPIDSIVAASLNSGTPAKSSLAPTRLKSKAVQAKEVDAEDSEATPVASSTPTAMKDDLEGHRAQRAIQTLMQQGIVLGYADGSFHPDAAVTDQQFSSMLNKASSKASTAIPAIKRPKDVVTRADAATFVYRQLQKAKVSNAEATNATAAKSVAQTSSAQLPQLASANLSVLKSTPAISQTTPNMALPSVAPDSGTGSRALPPEQVPTEAPRAQAVRVAVANIDAYTLGAGDRLKVDVFNVPEYSKEYQVLVNGTLNLYRVGNVSVTGMSLKQAERAIAAKYARVLKHPMVDVSLAAARPLNVAIAGEVGRPGSYSLESKDGKFPTVTKVIQEAGGMTRSANPRQVVVRRPQLGGTDREITIDLWELFQTGNIRQDLTLLDGDTIFIPTSNGVNLAESAQFAAANFATDAAKPINIAVVGEVNRPGPYALEVKAGLPTITQALQTAGGINQMANVRKIEVRRSTRAGTNQTIPIDLWKLLKEGDLSQDLVLQQGDTIAIPTATALDPAEASKLGSASFSPATMNVNVVGEVTRPGTVQVAANTPLNQAILAAGGFNKDAKKKTVELIRLNPNGTVVRREIAIDLARGIDEKGNPILQNGDVVVVDKSGAAKFSQTLETVLGPVGRLLPFRYLFGF